MRRFIIRNTSDQDLFWNNEFGWADRKSATVFDSHERQRLCLPMDGKWIKRDRWYVIALALLIILIVIPALGGCLLNLIPLLFEASWDWQVFAWGCFFVYVFYFAIGIDPPA